MAYKVGDKFIIEIERVLKQQDMFGYNLYRFKNFEVVNEYKLSELEKYEENPFTQEDYIRERKEGYDGGLKDAWEAARTIINMKADEFIQCFNFLGRTHIDIFADLSATEAIAKIKDYEEKKAEKKIKVGDEVMTTYGTKFVVTGLSEIDCFGIESKSGLVCAAELRICKKTGRYFDIEGILKAMREE